MRLRGWGRVLAQCGEVVTSTSKKETPNQTLPKPRKMSESSNGSIYPEDSSGNVGSARALQPRTRTRSPPALAQPRLANPGPDANDRRRTLSGQAAATGCGDPSLQGTGHL